ncbi:Kinase-like protein [Mycena venus]|uniref:Kinase-like protein n=1 Tax=Mycena venus TaxID=2733690 RepID=A0A8H6YD62_9AGAR|nr:Kinase-like protein [Mycena venus]
MAAQDNPVMQKILQFLNTSLDPLIYGRNHARSAKTRPPIPYDYHMPPWLQLAEMEYNPDLPSKVTAQLIKNLANRKSIIDQTMDVEPLIHGASFRIGEIVPRPQQVIGEPTVYKVQGAIHNISGMFATLSCFDIDSSEIHRFRSVFMTNDPSESNTKADRLIKCQPEPLDEQETWGSLWSSIKEPRDLSKPFFDVLYTEEYKSIRAGNPRTILGIYIIMWCLREGHLETFWPQNHCEGCSKFIKSHQADEEYDRNNPTVPEDCPVDGLLAATTLVGTDPDRLREEINRLIDLAGVYEKKYSIPPEKATQTQAETQTELETETETETNRKRKRPRNEDSETEEEEVALPFEDLLENAMYLAVNELKLPEEITDGLFRWVLHAAYILIQIWAQMVRHNGTVAHLTCHNLGVIVTRHRKTQTLVVSKFLEYTDAPILRATALTVFAYDDAVERYDEHEKEGVPEWVEDPFRGETQEEQKAKKKARTANKGSKDKGPSAKDDDNGDDNQGGSSDNRGGGGAGGSGGAGSSGGAGGSGGGAGGSGGGPGNGSSGGGNGPRRSMRLKGAGNGQQDNLNLDGVHLAFKAARHHLWSKGFSHFRRLVDATAATPNPALSDLTPRVQDHGSAYFSGSRNIEATFTLNPSDQQRRASAGSTHSSRSTASHTSVKSLFSDSTSSSMPTSPSTTASFAASSRDGSPFPEKSAGLQTGSSEPTSAPVCNAGILINDSLGKSAIGIVWSGNMVLEDGNDDDYSIPVAVKMAILKGRDNTDPEAETDERDTIRREGLVYDFLVKSGKEGITPRYYGVFEDSLGTVALILDNGGTALKTFNNLPGEQAQKLFAKAEGMHSVGVRHNDLVPRNVVQDSEGNLKIIDFHIAEMGHRCRGRQECKELAKLSKALGL